MDEHQQDLVKRIRSGDRYALSRAITYAESSLPAHKKLIDSVLSELMPHTGQSIRIGITGSPGVGKSTFIEAFGQCLIEAGHRVAVLAIDPSSRQTGGSILGDKTRMEQLGQHEQAFIRPSPAGRQLGGVTQTTRESILLCEATGFDVILIETVGVGQSETAVFDMVDFYMLLILPGSGDELQGIKRGVVELADLVLINKADGDRVALAQQSKAAYKSALHVFPKKPSGWIAEVETMSALEKQGMGGIWERVSAFETMVRTSGYFSERRNQQLVTWFEEAINQQLFDRFYANENLEKALKEAKSKVLNKKITPFAAASELILLLLSK